MSGLDTRSRARRDTLYKRGLDSIRVVLDDALQVGLEVAAPRVLRREAPVKSGVIRKEIVELVDRSTVLHGICKFYFHNIRRIRTLAITQHVLRLQVERRAFLSLDVLIARTIGGHLHNLRAGHVGQK